MSIPLPGNVDVSFGNKDVPCRRVFGIFGQLDDRKNQCDLCYSVFEIGVLAQMHVAITLSARTSQSNS